MTQRKNHFISEENVKKLSIAIRLIDDFTDTEPIGNVTVSIKDIEKKPVKNLTGYYLFTNLPPTLDKVEVVVNSDFYLQVNEVRLFAQTPDNPMVVVISMVPNCTYPFLVESTLLRAIVRKKSESILLNQNPNQLAIPEASVNIIIYQPESTTIATARVGTGGAVKGKKTLRLKSFSSSLNVSKGDWLMIEESSTGNMEFCQISEPLPGNPALEDYNLTKDLKFNHDPGKPVFLMKGQNRELATRTNDKGEMVLYFKHSRVNRFLIDGTIRKEGYQYVKLDKIEMIEGTTNWLGVIELLPEL